MKLKIFQVCTFANNNLIRLNKTVQYGACVGQYQPKRFKTDLYEPDYLIVSVYFLHLVQKHMRI